LPPRYRKRKNQQYYRRNREDLLARANGIHKRNRDADVIGWRLSTTKSAAKKKNLPFNLTREDIVIPELCPVFGTPMTCGGGKTSDRNSVASVDKIIPRLGYVRGNIVIVSFKANRMKSDGTLEEVVALGRFYGKILDSRDDAEHSSPRIMGD
jgi:hypothetical protein